MCGPFVLSAMHSHHCWVSVCHNLLLSVWMFIYRLQCIVITVGCLSITLYYNMCGPFVLSAMHSQAKIKYMSVSGCGLKKNRVGR